MKYYMVLYDVGDINQLLAEELKNVIGSLNIGKKECSLEEALYAWYRISLDKMHCCLFYKRARNDEVIKNSGGVELYERITTRVKPAYSSIVYRMVRIPIPLYEVPVVKMEVDMDKLILYFDKEEMQGRVQRHLLRFGI